jgi:hypothetical protein
MITTSLLIVLFGAALLLAGRSLFWLLIGLIAFLTVYQISLVQFSEVDELTRVFICIACGALAGVLAIFFQKVLIALAGFFITIQVIQTGLHITWENTTILVQALVLLAAIVGGACSVFFFDYALVALSSLYGSLLITNVIMGSNESIGFITCFIILTLVGIFFQTSLLEKFDKSTTVKEKTL